MEGAGAVDRIEYDGKNNTGNGIADQRIISRVYSIPGIYKSDDLEQTGTDRT